MGLKEDLASLRTSSSSSGGKKALTKDDAQRQLDKRLQKIIDYGNPEAAQRAINASKSKGSKWSPVLKGLSVLGKPLSAVVSTEKEIVDAIQGQGFSAHDWKQQFDRNYGYGNMLEDLGPNAPIWAKRVGGFVGDVVMDPLTYLAPEAKLHNAGKVVGALREVGMEEAATKVLKKGVASLTDEELAKIGARGGVYFNIPGTGRVGRAITRSGADAETQQIRLLARNRLTTGAARTANTFTRGIRDAETAQKVARLIGGDRQGIKEAIRSGDPERALKAYDFLKASTHARNIERGTEQELGSIAHKILTDADKGGVDMIDLFHAGAGDVESAARVERVAPGLTARVKDLMAQVPEIANSKAGVDWLHEVENYMPRLSTQEAVDAGVTRGAKGASDFGRSPMEHLRVYVGKSEAALNEGRKAEFLGEALEDVGKSGKSIEKQMDEIAQRVLGEDAVKLFDDRLDQVLPRYLKAVSKKTGQRYLEQRALELGIADPKWIKAADHAGIGAKAAKAFGIRKLDDLRMAHRITEAADRRAAAELAAGQAEATAKRGAAETLGAALGGPLDSATQKSVDAFNEFGLLDEGLADQTAAAGQRESARLQGEGQTIMDQGRGADVMAQAEHVRSVEGVQDAALAANDAEKALTKAEARLTKAEASKANRLAKGAQYAKDIAAHTELQAMLDDARLELMQRAEEAGRTPEIVAKQRGQVNLQLRQLRQKQTALESIIANANNPYIGDVLAKDIVASDSGMAATLGDNYTMMSKSAFDEAREVMRRAGWSMDDLVGQLRATQESIAQGESFAARLSAEHRAFTQTFAADQQALDAMREMIPEADPVAKQFGLLDQEMQGLPGAMPNPHNPESDMFFHGTRGTFDAENPPAHLVGGSDDAPHAVTTESDVYVGPHFAGEPRTAAEYAHPDGSVGNARIHAENPKVYGDISATEAERRDSVLATGSGRGNGLRHLHNDLFRTGWESGLITPEMLAASATDPTVGDAWHLVGDLVDNEGMDLEDAIYHAFSEDPDVSHLIEEAGAFGEEHGDDLSDAIVTDPVEFVYSHVVYRVNAQGGDWADNAFGQLTPKQWSAVGSAFKEKAAAEGFDSVLYTLRSPSDYAIIPLDARQIEFKSAESMTEDYVVLGKESFYDYWQKRQTLLDKIEEPIYRAQDEVERAGAVFSTATDAVNEAKRIEAQNARRMHALTREQAGRAVKASKIMDRATQVEQTAATAELALRQRAAKSYAQAKVMVEDANNAAKAAYNTANKQAVDAEIRVVHLEAAAASAQADLIASHGVMDKWGEWINKIGDPATEKKIKVALREGFKDFGPNTTAPDWVVDSITAATKMETPEGLKPFVRMWDGFTNTFKGYATMTPGFHSRNFMGGVFNNWLAGVEMGTTRRFMRAYYRYTLGKEPGLVGKELEAFEKIVDGGLLSGGQTANEIERRTSAIGRSFNPLNSQNVLVQGNRAAGSHVENVLRGSLAYDTLLKGGDIEEAASQIAKYHFDYDDLAPFERSVLRRVIPFYTWTRKNVPLMLESVVREPGKFNRYLIAKRNIELGNPDEDVVPGYFGEQLGIHLPFKSQGGDNYLLPDLPFRDLARTADPGQLLSQMNPLIKTPLEVKSGKQFFNDAPIKKNFQEVPAAFRAIPGLVPALKVFGKVRTGANGKPMVRGTDLYILEQTMPIFGRARRLFPSEEKYNQRTATSWLGFVFGAGVRTNTDTEQRNELLHRLATLDSKWKDMTDLNGGVALDKAAGTSSGTDDLDGLNARMNELMSAA